MKAHFFPFFLVVSLTGCVESIETRVNSSGENGLGLTSYVWTSPVGSESSDLVQAKHLIGAQLGMRGYTEAETGVVHVEVTLAARPTNLALTAGSNKILTPAKKRRMLDSCRDKEYRLGIALTRISDGTILFRGNAAEYHCKTPIAETLPALVTAALADLGAPKGSYVIKRSKN